ncbi:unnamed protein product [Calicophoron daubneyi]|uniref:Major facilitator superfamily (MFS) profile domain-containing protein n=1 Tax=Calicophoron daubneyi TaxID=300641 RepID=A0AAV2TFL3_CALDB
MPKCRYILAVTLFMYMCIGYMVRVNINVTLLSMVNDTANVDMDSDNMSVCAVASGRKVNQTRHSVGTYIWDRPTQGLVLGAFFYGYLVTQIPGALLCLRFGPRIVGLISVVCFSLLDIFIPLSASVGYEFLMFLRILEGLAQGVMMSLACCLIGRWALASEVSRFSAFVYSGCQIGTVLGQVIAGVLSQTRERLDPGSQPYYVSYWPVVHYVFGGLGLLLAVFWMFTVYDSPDKHPRISMDELSCLQPNTKNSRSVCQKIGCPTGINHLDLPASVKSDETKPTAIPSIVNSADHSASKPNTPSMLSVPWDKMFRTRALWSILICHICFNWAWYSMLTCVPSYMSRVQGFDLSENGFLSSVPYITEWFVCQIAAFTTDNMVHPLGGAGAGSLAVGLIGCNRVGAVILLAITISLLGFGSSGYVSNMVDIAPAYSGNIMSFTNTISTLPGILGPLLVGVLTRESSSVENWMIVFGISTAIAWFGAIVNLLLTDSTQQLWGKLITDGGESNIGVSKSSLGNQETNVKA